MQTIAYFLRQATLEQSYNFIQLASRFYSNASPSYSVQMFRHFFYLASAIFILLPDLLYGFGDDGPPISIKSPDTGTTFPHADIKSHKLVWFKNREMLVACVTFTDARQSDGNDAGDTHYLDLPGVKFDKAKGLFTATTAQGEVIPVAQIKKTLFLENIEILPNAVVRILSPQGNITVILEAVSPNDPALHKPPPETDADSTQGVDFHKLFK